VDAVRVNWQLKALLPVVFVLLVGLLLFTAATVSFRDPERHAVLFVAGAGAVIICAVSIGVLAYLIHKPMVELQEKVALISEGQPGCFGEFFPAERRNRRSGPQFQSHDAAVAREPQGD
jgi:hypothetical protein